VTKTVSVTADGSPRRQADPPLDGRVAEIEAFWLDYQRACKVAVPGFGASALGHTRVLADTLAGLVVGGVKRAQATPLRDFEGEGADALPQPGDHLVVLDGNGTPRAIVRNTQVERRHFNQIDETFAFEAGEGDLTLAWWLTAHRQDYAERAEVEGFAIDERLPLLLEHFELVWPVALPSVDAPPPV
jgi:uncharacterized protein YhfF